MAAKGHAITSGAGFNMKVAFRADASLQIGTGHVMRCLTLADSLAAKGAGCEFMCRAHEGNLIEFIRSKGYVVHPLPIAQKASTDSAASGLVNASTRGLAHRHWLGVTQAQDFEACAPLLAAQRPDWLIVDHYSLDARWERALADHYRKLMVIDDLADRSHVCQLLLDQTFGRDAANYRTLVPADCRVLCGSQYALLRPEFAALRPFSLQRRVQPVLRELLITMGGVDKDNATGQVLQALRACPLPADCRITVVMGATAPWLDMVRIQAREMTWQIRVLMGVSDMAQLMADSDLAIGAAGATSWERCCLGLPTGILVLAENQRYAAGLLEKIGAVKTLLLGSTLVEQISDFILDAIDSSEYLKNLSVRASAITDGRGCVRVADSIFAES
jgi:UDP-2,4-diacetamido-2,4,6-trideoxy-beta-L-altropyranose hydrolase